MPRVDQRVRFICQVYAPATRSHGARKVPGIGWYKGAEVDDMGVEVWKVNTLHGIVHVNPRVCELATD